MTSVNWTEVLAIFVGFGTFFIYLMSRLDNIRRDLKTHIDDAKAELRAEIRDADKKIEAVQKDVNRIDSKVSNIEGQITQMTRPNIIPLKRSSDEDIKEN